MHYSDVDEQQECTEEENVHRSDLRFRADLNAGMIYGRTSSY
jgi:hypothetical protein